MRSSGEAGTHSHRSCPKNDQKKRQRKQKASSVFVGTLSWFQAPVRCCAHVILRKILAAATREHCAWVWAQVCVTNLSSSRADFDFAVPSTPVHMANGTKNYMKKPSHLQDGTVNSSEDHCWPRGTPRHISESSFGLSGGLREGSLSSQDSRTESASLSQSQVNGFFASHAADRSWQDSQRGSPSPSVISKATEKKWTSTDSNRSKAKNTGISDAPDYSDRGDSDMDEATYSSSQDHHIPKKAPFNLNFGFYFFSPHLTKQTTANVL